MALIKCPECGKEISDRAVSCPHCVQILLERYAYSEISGTSILI